MFVKRWTNTDDWTLTTMGGVSFAVSPVVDTRQAKSVVLNSVLTFNPAISEIQCSFRANDTVFVAGAAGPPYWTELSLGQSDSEEKSLTDLGHFVRGRYVQMRAAISQLSDIYTIRLVTEHRKDTHTFLAQPSYEQGMAVGYLLPTMEKTVSKISLDLKTVNLSRREYISDLDGVFCCPCANFQSCSSGWDWTLSHGLSTTTFHSLSHNSITSRDVSTLYNPRVDSDVPFVSYHLGITEPGLYDIYLRGYCPSGAYWLRQGTSNSFIPVADMSSGGDFQWVKCAQFYFVNAEVAELRIYLGNQVGAEGHGHLDAVYVTNDPNRTPADDEIAPFSPAPFNLYVWLWDVEAPHSATTRPPANWLTSLRIPSSGKFNFDMQGSQLIDDYRYRITFLQIGGDENNFAAWAYEDVSSPIGTAQVSYDQATTFEDVV